MSSDYHDGYEATTQPRRRARFDGPSHFAIVEREGADPEEAVTGQVNRCRNCMVEGTGMILHADPDSSDPRRCICGKCQGGANARRMGAR